MITPITTSTDCRAFMASCDVRRASANCFSRPSFSLSVDLCVVCAESSTPVCPEEDEEERQRRVNEWDDDDDDVVEGID